MTVDHISETLNRTLGICCNLHNWTLSHEKRWVNRRTIWCESPDPALSQALGTGADGWLHLHGSVFRHTDLPFKQNRAGQQPPESWPTCEQWRKEKFIVKSAQKALCLQQIITLVGLTTGNILKEGVNRRKRDALGPPPRWRVLGYAQDWNQTGARYSVRQIY